MSADPRSALLSDIDRSYPEFDGGLRSEIEKVSTLTQASYGASIDIISAVFYQHITCHLDNYPNVFEGNFGGISGMFGTYSSVGDVYTDNLENLFSSTKSIMFVFTPVYCSVIWFDSGNKSLGSFHGSGFTLLAGTGGGTGKWKPD